MHAHAYAWPNAHVRVHTRVNVMIMIMIESAAAAAADHDIYIISIDRDIYLAIYIQHAPLHFDIVASELRACRRIDILNSQLRNSAKLHGTLAQ